MRIRSELIIFFLLVSVIPLSLVVYISYDYSKDAIRDSVMASLLGATENTGNAIDYWMDARKDDMRVISSSSIVAIAEKEELRKYLNTFENKYPDIYKEFFILDLKGNITFSTLYSTGNASKERYFIEAVRGKLYVSDVSLSVLTGSPEIIITNPIRKNGVIVGVLAARISMDRLYRIIENIDIGRSGEVFIVNKDGDLIFHRNRSKILLDNIKNNFAVKEVTYEMNGIDEYINYNGKNVLGSYYWLPLYRWGLIVEMNRDEAYAGVLALGQLMIGISSLGIISVVLLALVISKRLTEPVKSLEDGALGLVKGNFKPVEVSSSNEIGRLTEIFNETAAELLNIRKKLETKIEIANNDLKEKNKELIAANEELKKLDILKSDFISLVSHELKTPLLSMRLSAEYLESSDNDKEYRPPDKVDQ